jgi:hypothetical protein
MVQASFPEPFTNKRMLHNADHFKREGEFRLCINQKITYEQYEAKCFAHLVLRHDYCTNNLPPTPPPHTHTHLRTLHATIEAECETVTFVHAEQKVTIGEQKNTHYQPCNKFLPCYFNYLQVVIGVTRKAT